MDLKARFYTLVAPWAKTPQIEVYWELLSKNHAQAFRHYHNFKHLEALFGYFDIYNAALKYPSDVAFAIFYHDSIYNIWSKKNELLSAELAKTHLSQTQLDPTAVSRIFNLILATKSHNPQDHTDEQWMVDFDIAILGQSWDTYAQYTKAIRKEYAAVPNLLYKKGRKKALQHFLDKPRIYHSSPFYEAYEASARTNLKKELNTL